MYDTEMNTIFMNSENSKISDPHKLSLNLKKKKKKLRQKDKCIALSNLHIYFIWKIIKRSYKNNRF